MVSLSVVKKEQAGTTPVTTPVEEWVNRDKAILEQACVSMQKKISDTGIRDGQTMIPSLTLAEFFIRQDPFDNSKTLKGTWYDRHGSPCGEIQLREDGSVYAEVNIICTHPGDDRWFVEAVSVWGTKDSFKTELILLPSV